METIGPIEITGFDGPITIASALRDRGKHLRCGLSLADALDGDLLDLSLSVLGDQVLLQSSPALRRSDSSADRLLAHRQHGGLDAEGSRDLRLSPGSGAALGHELAAIEAGREVAVGEPEPVGRAQLDQPVEDRE